jgi:multidrug efflux pump subunit AcrA (membrane-fusion protein)
LLKAQDDALQLAKATRATERFLEKHPEYVRDDRNRDAMIAYLKGGGFQWDETSLEIAYSELQHSGRYVTQAQLDTERAQAQQAQAEKARLQAEEAQMRSRGKFSAASQPYIPTPEELRQREAEEARQEDDRLIREAEDLVSCSPQQYKSLLTHKTEWAGRLEQAYTRRNARRLGR